MVKDKKPTKQLNIAISADLYDWCRQEAQKDSRSLANFIRLKLQQLREAAGCKKL